MSIIQSGNLPTKRKFEFDYIKGTNLPFSFENVLQLSLQPHQGSLLQITGELEIAHLGCETNSTKCTCTKGLGIKQVEIFPNERVGLFLVDPISLPIECISNLLLEWKRKSQNEPNIGLGIIVRGRAVDLVPSLSFSLFREGFKTVPQNHMNRNSIWLPSLAISENILREAESGLNPYDLYPLVDYSDDQFIVSNSGILENVEFLEYSRTRTRNFIYLDVSRPDATFSRLSQTIDSLLKSDFSAYEPVLTPGGSSNSFIAEVCAAVLNGAKLFTPMQYVPFSDNKEISGFIILRNLL